ncbi:BnaAnng27560D [Brassica napus]|uniref:BnaAnng27560D protein n=1 Tax=Brassica napus TaxID=3708 RepID=A0A078JLX7_BRANA|nr:BnaAnng27560D [Brassica napus]
MKKRNHHNTVLEQEHKKNKEKRKDEAYEKAKEKFQDEDGSKLDKLIQMLYDLNKQVEVIENVLGVADGYESPCNYDDTKGAPNDENEEEEISGGKMRIHRKSLQTKTLKKMTSSTPTFTTPNFDIRV